MVGGGRYVAVLVFVCIPWPAQQAVASVKICSTKGNSKFRATRGEITQHDSEEVKFSYPESAVK